MTGEPWDGRHVVYRLYNRHGRCIYIGCTIAFDSRLASHRTSSPFADEIVRARITVHTDRRAALQRERAEIVEQRPRYNITGRPRRYDWGVVDYVEVLEALRARRKFGFFAGTSGPNNIPAVEHAFRRHFPEVAELVLAAESSAA